ncbi:MAG: glycoside hydrolase family 2 protein [Opitutales bacterium]
MNTPRPHYPTLAPSLDAVETLSLDGSWEIVFDRSNVGRTRRWTSRSVFETLERRSIQVPSSWEEVEQDYEGVAFYGKRFKLRADWKDRVVRLQFDAVNYIAEVWLNDHCVGRHEGGYGPFEFRVDDLLDFEGDNFLSLRVLGPIIESDQVIDGLGRNDAPHWRGAITGGVWQSVRLVSSGPVLIEDAFVIPQVIDSSVVLDISLENTGTQSREESLRVLISREGETAIEHFETLQLIPGANSSRLHLHIPGAHLWSPNEPNLYTLELYLGTSDQFVDRFGMRELTMRENRFELNGSPVYIKAAFFEGLYPHKLAAPESREVAEKEIRLAKEAGFNMIRPWRKDPPPMWLDLCDEIGVMVVGGFPIECMNLWPTVTPHLQDRIEQTIRSGISRDRNRACIVQWELFNEIYRKDLGRLKHGASLLARKLDPSRMILDESGGFAGGSNIYLPNEWEPVLFNDVHIYPGSPVSQEAYEGFLTLAKTESEIQELGLEVPPVDSLSVIKPGLLTYVSEIGFGSLPDLEANNARFRREGNPLVPPYRYHRELEDSYRAALKDSGLDSVFPNLRDFCMALQKVHGEGNKRMIEGIRLNSSTCGYAVHSLTDGDWIVGAAILDIFRDPKPAVYEATQEANAQQYVAVNVLPRNIDADTGAALKIHGINELAEAAGQISIDIRSSDGMSVFEKSFDSVLKHGISYLSEIELNTREWSGAYVARVQFQDDTGSVLAQNTVSLDVFEAEKNYIPIGQIALLDVKGNLRAYCDVNAISYVEFDDNLDFSVPVFVTGDTDSAQLDQLTRFAENGGTVVFLERGTHDCPLPAKKEGAKGLWVGIAHVIKEHPIFAGLPVDGLMGQVYENIWAHDTLIGLDTQPIVASMTHGHWPVKTETPNYLGPDPVWWGSDLGFVQRGKGRFLISALRLVDNLGQDPVADRVLFNMIKYLNEEYESTQAIQTANSL